MATFTGGHGAKRKNKERKTQLAVGINLIIF